MSGKCWLIEQKGEGFISLSAFTRKHRALVSLSAVYANVLESATGRFVVRFLGEWAKVVLFDRLY